MSLSRLYLTYRLSIVAKGTGVKGCLVFRSIAMPESRADGGRRLSRASKVEIGGENRGQRIKQGGPATFSQRTSLRSAQPFVGQHDFRDRTLVEKVQRDDGFPVLHCFT